MNSDESDRRARLVMGEASCAIETTFAVLRRAYSAVEGRLDPESVAIRKFLALLSPELRPLHEARSQILKWGADFPSNPIQRNEVQS
jgi:hypothetical protein